jgi:vacuolar-type H+-ATPase subunit I/STV1
MLRSVPMVHFQAQVPSRQSAAATRCIAAEGLLHLVDIAHGRVAGAAPPDDGALLAAFRDLARRGRHLASRLDLLLPDPAGALAAIDVRDLQQERTDIEARLAPVEQSVEAVLRREAEAADALARARTRLAHAARLLAAQIDADRLSRLRFVAVQVGLVPADDLAALAGGLGPAPFAIVPLAGEPRQVLVAAAVQASCRDRLDNAQRGVAFEAIAPLDRPESWSVEALERDAAEAAAARERAGAELAARRPDLVSLIPSCCARSRSSCSSTARRGTRRSSRRRSSP